MTLFEPTLPVLRPGKRSYKDKTIKPNAFPKWTVTLYSGNGDGPAWQDRFNIWQKTTGNFSRGFV